MKALALVALLSNGCMFGFRAGAFVTVDTFQHPGAMVGIGGSVGQKNVIASPVIEGAILRPTPFTVGLRATGAVEFINRWQRLGFRVGPRAGIAWVESKDGKLTGGDVGGTIAILPTLYDRTEKRPNCTSDRRTTYHLGVAANGDYDWADHRGHFGLGPTFEIYSDGDICDL